MDQRSSTEFSIGVPVIATRIGGLRARTALAAWVSWFFTIWASSRTSAFHSISENAV